MPTRLSDRPRASSLKTPSASSSSTWLSAPSLTLSFRNDDGIEELEDSPPDQSPHNGTTAPPTSRRALSQSPRAHLRPLSPPPSPSKERGRDSFYHKLFKSSNMSIPLTSPTLLSATLDAASTRKMGRKLWIVSAMISLVLIYTLLPATLSGQVLSNFPTPTQRHLPSLHHQTCSPYTELGVLNVSRTDPHANRWIPFDETCQAPALLASALMTAWSERDPTLDTAAPLRGDWETEGWDPRGETWEDVEWARGRTIVLVGDSLTRENIKYWCQMFGEPLIEIPWSHPFSPPIPTGPDDPLIPDPDPSEQITRNIPDIDEADRGSADSHGAHYCHIPSLDLMVIQVFQFGMDEDGYWSFRESTRPYLIEDRISYLAKGYVQRTGRGEPDLVMVGSALWDAAKWMRDDLEADDDVDAGLSQERAKWYRGRVREVLETTIHTFPQSKIQWMTNHYPAVGKNHGWFLAGVKTTSKQRPFHRLNRLAQMNQAARSAYEKDHLGAGVDTNMWGEVMIGQEKWQRDDLHHLMFPGGYVWADILLYDLKAAVEERRRWW